MIDISIIVPVYNVESFVEKCLESIIKQTVTNIEIIVVDDGSTDNSKKIIEGFLEKDKRIQYIYQKNQGLGPARNTGIKKAKGKYIGFVDSDDFIESDMYEKLLEKGKKNDLDIVGCNYKNSYDNGIISEKIYKLKSDILKIENIDNFIINNFLAHDFGCEVWSKIFKREIIVSNNIFFEDNKEIFAEDWLFDLYFLIFCKKIGFVNEGLYYHYMRSDSIMHSKKPQLTKRLITLIKRVKNKYKENKIELSSIVDITYHLIVFSIVQESKMKDKYRVLEEVFLDDEIYGYLVGGIKKNSFNLNKKIFCILVKLKLKKIAIFYRMLVEKILVKESNR